MYLSNSELVAELESGGVLRTPNIKEAFLTVDRKNFVTKEYQKNAYVDFALPIGYGQTISQPYTVAFMLELLNPKPGERVLDVGSGSGWTTALLAQIVGMKGMVFGVEIIPELVAFGQKNLDKYNFEHASIKRATRELGYAKEAPYDKILVSAAGTEIPPELERQLKIGGVMVLPVGNAILKIMRRSKTESDIENFEGFVFVPLINGKY